ncbi:MAG: GDP-mannose 4,6-dehydratase, partial [Acetivibrio ethanolgignens]
EKGYDSVNGKLLVDVNPKLFRPSEVELLWGDSTKAEKDLGWNRKVDFKGLVHMMVDEDMKAIVGVSAKEFRER